jgi:DNA-binding transcriptional ArsR family regulator
MGRKMTQSDSQDAITQKQELFMEITDETVLSMFKDENLMKILTFLRSTPHMTVKEFETAFEESGEGKSDKSIYRYLKKLEKGNLIIQSGKRVFTDKEKRLRTETLYMRTAKIFFPKWKSKKKLSEDEQCSSTYDQAFQKLFSKWMETDFSSLENIIKVIEKINEKKFEYSTAMMKNADEEAASLVSALDWPSINSLIDTLGLVALLCDDIDWKTAILSCC